MELFRRDSKVRVSTLTSHQIESLAITADAIGMPISRRRSVTWQASSPARQSPARNSANASAMNHAVEIDICHDFARRARAEVIKASARGIQRIVVSR